jgi:hypothetical protein
MQKFVLATLVAGASLLAAVSVYADGTKPRVATVDSFTALDRNGDQRISRSEAGFDRVLSETFADIDTDGDGFVSPAEFAAAGKREATVNNVNSR